MVPVHFPETALLLNKNKQKLETNTTTIFRVSETGIARGTYEKYNSELFLSMDC
jgi:hypothetical protein